MAVEQRESHQSGHQDGAIHGGAAPASQESVDLLTKLLQEFYRRTTPTEVELPPEVKRDVEAVAAIVESIQNAIALKPRAMAITELCPDSGPCGGGTLVRIHGKRFVPGSTVFFGEKQAENIKFVCQTELQVTAPSGTGCVDVIVSSLAGRARLENGFSYGS